MSIKELSTLMAKTLDIDERIILTAIPNYLLDQQLDEEQTKKMTELIKSDEQINNFGITQRLGDNFVQLKHSLANLQILAFIKSLKTAEKCEDVLNTFVVLMSDKIAKVNDVLKSNLQSGGGYKKYFKKYIKYKKKYLLIKKYII